MRWLHWKADNRHVLFPAVQAKQLLGTQQFHQSQLKEALVETYLGLDEVMAQEGTREQLRELAGGSSEKGADDE